MCNKLNSVYWAFHIGVNYIIVCTLHFCITRFEGKISDLKDLKSGRSIPTPKHGGPAHFIPPPKITTLVYGVVSYCDTCTIGLMMGKYEVVHITEMAYRNAKRTRPRQCYMQNYTENLVKFGTVVPEK